MAVAQPTLLARQERILAAGVPSEGVIVMLPAGCEPSPGPAYCTGEKRTAVPEAVTMSMLLSVPRTS